MSEQPLSGKTAIVTGASSGLGETFARALAAAGAQVVLAARRVERLELLASDLAAGGAVALPLPCDVTDADAVASMVEQARQRFGRIDVLVNNAGVAADGGFAPEKVPPAVFEQTIRVNVVGLWYCCQQVAHRMLEDGGGSIVNVASVAGMAGLRDFPPAYQASKGAVIALTRSLACSWADRGVRVNALAPGWFPSEMTERGLRDSGLQGLGGRQCAHASNWRACRARGRAAVPGIRRVELRHRTDARRRWRRERQRRPRPARDRPPVLSGPRARRSREACRKEERGRRKEEGGKRTPPSSTSNFLLLTS